MEENSDPQLIQDLFASSASLKSKVQEQTLSRSFDSDSSSEFVDALDFVDEPVANDLILVNESDFIEASEDNETSVIPLNKAMSYVTTHENKKIPPPIETNAANDRIDIKWNPPETIEDKIDFYEILYREKNSDNTDWETSSFVDKTYETSIIGLKPGTENDFKIKTIFKNKEIYFSEPIVTLRTEPLTKKPSQLTGKEITNQSLVLAWKFPYEDESIVYFDVCYRQKNNNKWQRGNSLDKFVTINKLLPETEYEFRVRAVSENNLGDYSDVYTLSTGVKLIKPRLFNVTNEEFSISWEERDIDSTVDVFEIKYREECKQNWNSIKTDKQKATLTGLKENTSYEVQILHSKGKRKDLLSGVCKVKTKAFPISKVKQYEDMQVVKKMPPGKPVKVSVSTSSVSLKWDISNIDKMAIQYHEIRYKECINDRVGWKPYPTHTSANEVTITNLKSMTSYEFTVKSILLSGETPLSPVSDAIITKPFIIENIKQTGQSHDSIAISWDRPKYDEDIIFYKVFFKAVSARNWITISTKARESQIVMSELSENTQYQVNVVAVTYTGKCHESTIVKLFKTVKKPCKNYPGRPKLITESSRSVTLKWQQCELSRFNCYEIQYRECNAAPTKWIPISTCVKCDSFTVSDLKCETFYEFKVAAVVDGEADKFSEISPKMKTSISIARKIAISSKNLIKISEGPPKRYKLPVKFMTADSR